MHEDFYKYFHHIGDIGHHAPLENSWCIVKSEWHSLESEGTTRVCEIHFLLIFYDYKKLVVPIISIKEVVVHMSC